MNKINFVDIKCCSNWGFMKKLISKLNFDHRTIFTEMLVAVPMKKISLLN